MSPLVANMVLSFCKTAGERFFSAHYPFRAAHVLSVTRTAHFVRRYPQASGGLLPRPFARRSAEPLGQPLSRSAPLSHPPSPRPPLPWRWMMSLYGAASESVPVSFIPNPHAVRHGNSALPVLHREPEDLAYSLPPSASGTALPPRRCCPTCTARCSALTASPSSPLPLTRYPMSTPLPPDLTAKFSLLTAQQSNSLCLDL